MPARWISLEDLQLSESEGCFPALRYAARNVVQPILNCQEGDDGNDGHLQTGNAFILDVRLTCGP